jgi:hypothetical protein
VSASSIPRTLGLCAAVAVAACSDDPAPTRADGAAEVAADVPARDVTTAPDALVVDVATDLAVMDIATDLAAMDVAPDLAAMDAAPDLAAMDGPAEDPVERALRTGVVGDATTAGLCASLQASVAAARARRLAVWSALYGTSPAGDVLPGTLTDFTWTITHDSMVIDSLDEERNVPFLVANALGRDGRRARARRSRRGRGGRVALRRARHQRPLGHGPRPARRGLAEARAEALFARAVRWLTAQRTPSGRGAQRGHRAPRRQLLLSPRRGDAGFFTRNFSAARLNADDTCESAGLPGCLASASLLVIGGDDGTGDDNSRVPLDAAAIERALDLARRAASPCSTRRTTATRTP